MGQVVDFRAAKEKILIKKAANVQEENPDLSAGEDKRIVAELGQCPMCSAPAYGYPNLDDPDKVEFAPEAIEDYLEGAHTQHREKLEQMANESRDMDKQLALLYERLLQRTDLMSEILVRKENQRFRVLLLNLMEEYSAQDNTKVREELWQEVENVLDGKYRESDDE